MDQARLCNRFGKRQNRRFCIPAVVDHEQGLDRQADRYYSALPLMHSKSSSVLFLTLTG